MQEEVTNRTVALTINTSRMTGRILATALKKLLADMQRARDSPTEIPHGKQSVKELIGQNAGVSNIEITSANIKSFERFARKYGVDFALKKDRSGPKPKYLVFFKARDADALTAAFNEFSSKIMRGAEKPSIRTRLEHFRAQVKNLRLNRVHKKEQELTR